MQPEIDLSGLRDLHFIAQPSIWPLPMGWWFLLVCLVLAVLGLVVCYVNWRKCPSVYACRKARQIAMNVTNELSYLKNLSQLLKRVAIVADGRPAVASLSDKKWQNFLCHRIKGIFSEEEAHLIAFAPYEEGPVSSVNRQILTQHATAWIKKILKDKKSS